ncbi:MAG: alpha/beta fold hydrolase [Chloroflexota bacterium]
MTLGRILDRWADERPDAPAVMDGATTWSWRELRDRAAALAGAIAGAGGGRPARIAVEPATSAMGVLALHAVLRLPSETILVPTRWTDGEVAELLERARPTVLVGPRTMGDIARVDPRAAHTAVLAPVRDPATLVVPTSGTTARPRLVLLPAAALEASAAAWAAVLPPATAWLLSLGLAHVAGIGIVVRAALAGVPVVLPDPDAPLAAAFDPVAGRPAVSHASVVATQLARLLEATHDAPPPPTVRAVLLGGGPVPAALVTRALDAGWPVWPTYGATETASGVAAASPDLARAHPWTAGIALPGAALRITDQADPTRILPPGSRGELQVRGPMLSPGDLGAHPGDSAPLPGRRTDDRWLRTGDLAELDADGRLRIHDRLDDVIISGGENVGPAEVEAVLAAQPGVREVAVVGAPDPDWGEVPVAVVAPVLGADPTDAALLAAARHALAGFRRPAAIVRTAALPRGGAEKILRRALRGPVAAAHAVAPAPAGERGTHLEIRIVLADDGQPLLVRAAPRTAGDRRPAVLLLHATLSSSTQLLRLAVELAPFARVILLDRRGSGGSRMAVAAPVTVGRHAEDAAQALAASGEPSAVLLGHSFGGVVALELAARHPDRATAVVAWEPPYVPVAPAPERDVLTHVAAAVVHAHATDGPSAAAHAFMDVVSPGAWDKLRPVQQEALGAEGDGVLADAAMSGLDPAALDLVRCPVVIGTGTASEPFYAPIAAALAARIPGATVATLPDLRHYAPIVTAAPVAALARPFLLTDPPIDPSQPEPAP